MKDTIFLIVWLAQIVKAEFVAIFKIILVVMSVNCIGLTVVAMLDPYPKIAQQCNRSAMIQVMEFGAMDFVVSNTWLVIIVIILFVHMAVRMQCAKVVNQCGSAVFGHVVAII
jgi:quinol-cytochrome oxidoreductase complex cytochrome b subunit